MAEKAVHALEIFEGLACRIRQELAITFIFTEEAILSIEYKIAELCDEFFKQTTSVNSVLDHPELIYELNSQVVLQVELVVVNFVESVLENPTSVDFDNLNMLGKILSLL